MLFYSVTGVKQTFSALFSAFRLKLALEQPVYHKRKVDGSAAGINSSPSGVEPAIYI